MTARCAVSRRDTALVTALDSVTNGGVTHLRDAVTRMKGRRERDGAWGEKVRMRGKAQQAAGCAGATFAVEGNGRGIVHIRVGRQGPQKKT